MRLTLRVELGASGAVYGRCFVALRALLGLAGALGPASAALLCLSPAKEQGRFWLSLSLFLCECLPCSSTEVMCSRRDCLGLAYRLDFIMASMRSSPLNDMLSTNENETWSGSFEALGQFSLGVETRAGSSRPRENFSLTGTRTIVCFAKAKACTKKCTIAQPLTRKRSDSRINTSLHMRAVPLRVLPDAWRWLVTSNLKHGT